ncbi:MAG: methionine--tRNA ligase [Sarcina sp.]
MNIIVGNAWPYASGNLHIGRIASWLPGDVIARYHRAKGDNVIFVSGSDCHGEIVLKKAEIDRKTAKEISDQYHEIFKENFMKLNFSFDNFAKTSDEYHKKNVKDFINLLNEKGLIYSKVIDIFYCNRCNKEVLDRLIDNGIHLNCGGEIVNKSVEKLFFKLSTFETYLEELLQKDLKWRENARKLTQKYLNEGLRDRALSRDINWGIEIPIEGFNDKKVFVWIEAVMGYMTASKKIIEERDEKFSEYWNNENSRVYLVHGKDNIPFHSIILPSIIAGLGNENCNLRIISSEHMNLEGKKFSGNKKWAIWLDDLEKTFDTDTLRYYLLINGAEEKTSNFTFRELINTNNINLLSIYGNFINRTLSFVQNYYEGFLDKQRINKFLEQKTKETYIEVSNLIEVGNLRNAIFSIEKLVKTTNLYFDKEKPWIAFRNDPNRCKKVIYNCALVLSNITNLLEPFIPTKMKQVREMMNITVISYKFTKLEYVKVEKVEVLFNKIDKKIGIDEIVKLKIRKK